MAYNIYDNYVRNNVPGNANQRPLAVGSPIVVCGYGWGIIMDIRYPSGGTLNMPTPPGMRILSVLFPGNDRPIDIVLTALTYGSPSVSQPPARY